jgi:hypothetical protein
MRNRLLLCLAIVMFAGVANVHSDSIFQTDYEDAVRRQRRGTIMTWTSIVTLSAGVFFATRKSDIGVLSIPSFAIGLYTGVRGSMVWAESGLESSRLGYAIENEQRMTGREIEAVRDERIFIGMSETGLRSSWGSPMRINTFLNSTSRREQFVYGTGGPYVYLENGRIQSIQN